VPRALDLALDLVGEKLSERIGQQVVIENRPSAGGIIAGSAVTSAQPDGYTLFMLTSGIALSKALLETAIRSGHRLCAGFDAGAVRSARPGLIRFIDANGQ
jgi:tripartite-type tricarboxylate transporter receptor subunit TctC